MMRWWGCCRGSVWSGRGNWRDWQGGGRGRGRWREEEAVDAGGHGRAGQGFEVLAGASVGVGRGDSVLANRVGGVKDHRVASLLEFIERARINHEVVVAKGVAALGQDDVAVAGRLNLGAHLGHGARSHHLSVLEVDGASGTRRLNHQRGLHAEVGRNLQNVHHLSHRLGLVRVVNVGQQAESVLALHLSQNRKALVQSRPHVVVDGAAVVLLKAGFVNDFTQRKALAHTGEVVGHAQRGVEGFNDAGSGD